MQTLNALAQQTAILNTKFDAHEKEDERRFELIKEAFIHSANNVDEVRKDLKKQSWFLTLIIGGLIALSRLPDILNVVHKAGATTLN